MLKCNNNLARKKVKNKYYFFNKFFKKYEYYRLFEEKPANLKSIFLYHWLKFLQIYLLTLLSELDNLCIKKDFIWEIIDS